MSSTITTAARRIARQSRGDQTWRMYFDADGRVVARIYGPEAFGPRRTTYAVQTRGKVTQLRAQQLLDAYTTARREVPGDDPVGLAIAYDLALADLEMEAAR